MANLSGGQYITFAKPYLGMLAEAINKGKPVKFDGNVSQKITKTPDVKKFLSAVKQQNENSIKNVLTTSGKFVPVFNGYRWTQIDKGQFTGKGGGGGGSDGASTAMQERGSLFAIQKGIEANGYKDQKKFYKMFRSELLKIYPDMNEEWENTFFQQQLTVVKELGRSKYSHYSRDDGFMDWITKFCKDKYNIAKKDSWNPADIWLVNDLNGVKKILEKKIIDDVTPIQQFNAILRDMWYDKKVVGISLKKMSGKVAKWELVNLENMDLFDNDEYQFDLDNMTCDLNLKDKESFKTSDSRINISSKKQKVTFQIRQNSAGFNNLKIEGTDLGAKSARLGKSPLDMVARVFSEYGLSFDNKNQNFPRSAAEFTKDYAVYKAIYNKAKQYTNVSSEAKFRDNIMAVYNSDRPDYAQSKLMQLKLFAEMSKLNKKKLNSLLTDLAFVAQKKGAVFGPFGKLY